MRPTPRPIHPSDYDSILSSDTRIYPTPSPLTTPSLTRWYTTYPSLGLIYESNQTLLGTCCAILLTKSAWEALTNGLLTESEISEKHLFSFNRSETEACVHIYHMEKDLRTWPSGYRMGVVVIEDLGTVIRTLCDEYCKDVSVVGFSGLTVSRSGVGLFSNLYNCRERSGYICAEYIIKNTETGELKVIEDIHTQEELEKALSSGPYEFITRCRMLTITRSEPSIIWRYLK